MTDQDKIEAFAAALVANGWDELDARHEAQKVIAERAFKEHPDEEGQMSERAEDVGPLVDKGRALLAGHAAHIQSAVLADLLAIYLAGHIVHDSPSETNALRARLLNLHIALVRELVPINAEYLHGKAKGQ